jgi:hypothetical protein
VTTAAALMLVHEWELSYPHTCVFATHALVRMMWLKLCHVSPSMHGHALGCCGQHILKNATHSHLLRHCNIIGFLIMDH